jgi:PAS domain S-box-containing protein
MAIMSHEWLCRRIVEDAQDAIIVGDQDGNIRLWNAGAETIFGHRAEEVMGKLMDFIIPENLRGRHWEGYHRVMETGETKYGKDTLAVPALRKDGTRISIEFTIVLLRDDEGKPAGNAAVIRDVTARWQKDKALKERLAELEKQVPRAG